MHTLKAAVRCALLVAGVLLVSRAALAQTDEIQVYDGAIAEPGQFNLTLHNNFTPAGATTPAFPGALVPDHSFNGVPEWAYGVTDWFEAGLYMPLYSVGRETGRPDRAMLDGFKLRLLFVAPHAEDRTFFYGANFEFSDNTRHWDTSRFSSEVRPIIGWHLKPVDIIFNPILDTAWDGLGNLDFAPATRIAYNWSERWATAVEEYDDFGPLHQFRVPGSQVHQVWGVVDHRFKTLQVEAGAGMGLNGGTDRMTLKLILSYDLNKRNPPTPAPPTGPM